MKYDVLIIGGGAAGFFAAVNIAEMNPGLKIAILEKGKEVLSKVKVSGGGRCNVTHAEFVPDELIKYYPRGEKELRGPFHAFCSGDTVEFFEKRGVQLKIEEDGRMFPVTDSSQTIIDCLVSEVKNRGIKILMNHTMKGLEYSGDSWNVHTNQGGFTASIVLIATGSSNMIWKMLSGLGHTIISPVPSLFTFNIRDSRLKGLEGVSVPATVKVAGSRLQTQGPLLITHWGMSGPAILKLSAWGARDLFELGYKFDIEVNWLKDAGFEEVMDVLKDVKESESKKLLVNTKPFALPKRLWTRLVESAGIPTDLRWAEVNRNQLNELAMKLVKSVFKVEGKSTFKEEFVTAGGVDLKEINFKTFESRLFNNLYFAGEVLNIDAITGGFNFQNAWTGAYIAAQVIASK